MNHRPKFRRPASSIPASTGWIAIFTVPLVYYLWPETENLSDRDHTTLFALTVFLVLALSEIFIAKIHRQPGSGLVYNPANFADRSYLSDYWIKLVGLATSFLLLGLFYLTADLYRDDWYSPFFTLLEDYWILILSVVLLTVTAVHFSMRHPRDGMWNLGMVVLSLGRRSTKAHSLKVHLLGLGVKGYFLPLMYCYLVYDWGYLNSRSLWDAEDFFDVYSYLFRFAFFFDLTIVTIGYATTTRLLTSQIRWTETTVSGWLVCLVCYAPFWQLMSRSYFGYVEDGFTWDVWLWDNPVLYGIWGSTILFFLSIYCLTAARMGLRFSNLTYRGLACDFPYNLSKHPSYISKNITWWMISIPFAAIDLWSGLTNCLALLGVNLIYFSRAWHEERCLSRAPSYRAYQRHVREYGLLARIKRGLNGKARSLSKQTN